MIHLFVRWPLLPGECHGEHDGPSTPSWCQLLSAITCRYEMFDASNAVFLLLQSFRMLCRRQSMLEGARNLAIVTGTLLLACFPVWSAKAPKPGCVDPESSEKATRSRHATKGGILRRSLVVVLSPKQWRVQFSLMILDTFNTRRYLVSDQMS